MSSMSNSPHSRYHNFLGTATTQNLLTLLESLGPEQFGISSTFGQHCIIELALANNLSKIPSVLLRAVDNNDKN